MGHSSIRIAAFGLLALSVPAAAETRAVPYWASIRSERVNMRVGPARNYRIAWVYQRRQLPLKVLRLKEGWRLVEDPDGTRGWMLAQFLSPDRSALVVGSGAAAMRSAAGDTAALLLRLEPGVVAKLGDCGAGWCRVEVGAAQAGYVQQRRLWGAGDP